MAHECSNYFRSASSHLDYCGESRANTDDIPEFWGMIVCMSPKIGADSALLIRLSYDDSADRTVRAAGSCFHSFFVHGCYRGIFITLQGCMFRLWIFSSY